MKKLITSLFVAACVLPFTQSCTTGTTTGNDSNSTATDTAATATDSVATVDTSNLPITLDELIEPFGDAFRLKEGISEELTSKGYKAGKGEDIKSTYISADQTPVSCEKVPYTKDDVTVDIITSTDEDYSGGEYVEVTLPNETDVETFIADAKSKGFKQESTDYYVAGQKGSVALGLKVSGKTISIYTAG